MEKNNAFITVVVIFMIATVIQSFDPGLRTALFWCFVIGMGVWGLVLLGKKIGGNKRK